MSNEFFLDLDWVATADPIPNANPWHVNPEDSTPQRGDHYADAAPRDWG
jgi:hypothetical protein